MAKTKVVIGVLFVLVLALSVVIVYVVIGGQEGALSIPGTVSQPNCVGTWVAHFGGFGDYSIRLDSDGTGLFQNTVRFTWQQKDNGFTAQIETSERGTPEMRTFSGQVSSDSRKMLVIGWGVYGFESSANTTFERL